MERLFKRPRQVVPLAETAPWPLYGNQRTDRSPDPLAPYNPTLNSKLYIHLGDITQLEVDAIVNAANNSLLGGGGVDGAIHAAAGPALRKECEGLRGCDTGDAKITAGHNLPAKHIIHTVGPRGKKPEVLQSSYDRCFETMRENELKSIAFPCISTGVYGYPNKAAARVAISTTRRFLENNHVEVEGVVFCLFTKEDIRAYHELLPVYFPLEPSDNTSEIQTSVDVTSNSVTCGSSEGETDKCYSKPIDTESQTSETSPEGEADSLNLPDVPKHEPGGEAMSQSVDVKSEEPMSQTADAFGSEECEAMSQEPNLGEQCEEPMSQTL